MSKEIVNNKTSNNIYADRIGKLRDLMRSYHVDALYIPTSDYHNSEYVGDYFKVREFLSGFTGSNGTLVVTDNKAGLWTDGRYFIQAQKELIGTGVTLYKMGEPETISITEFLASELREENCLGLNAMVVPASEGIKLTNVLWKKNINTVIDCDFIDEIWTERPPMSANPIWIMDDKFSGEKAEDKIEKVKKEFKNNGADAILITKLDDIMWLLNIRGSDIECNPVAMTNLYIDDSNIVLFANENAIDDKCYKYFNELGIEVKAYIDTKNYLKNSTVGKRIQADRMNCNYMFWSILSENGQIIDKPNPTGSLKSIKNAIELSNLRKTYIEDSAALTKFIFYLKEHISDTEFDEYSASKVLDSMRTEIPGFLDLSFPTIGAYAENGAIVHYEPTKSGAKKLENKGLFLVDSGGQYIGGTTDVTRTIVLGLLTDEMRKHYTLTAVGMLRLANAVFMRGCTGRNLDIIAREPLWKIGYDYKHGTGHGIGYVLNVHEGPQNIRWRYLENSPEALLVPGMIVSDEPGVYIEGSHGIRIENILEVVLIQDNESGEFLGFNHLTYVPLDLDAIDIKYLEKTDIELINEYHKNVFDKLSPYMIDEHDYLALKSATKPI